jgi:hypothetical protein
MVDNAIIPIEIQGHTFPVHLHDNYFELHSGEITDSKRLVLYRGPKKSDKALSPEIRKLRKSRPDITCMWRKCKTVLKITSRFNEDVWAKLISTEQQYPAEELYISELIKAHIPIVNKLIQLYRIATYDYFAFELAPWDIPQWIIERDANAVTGFIMPYRTWDYKPLIYDNPNLQIPEKLKTAPVEYQLIKSGELLTQASVIPTPGELEVLDAQNLMERGDYSGAVRRITTAIEVVVEDVLYHQIEAAQGKQQAEKYIKNTMTNFPRRVAEYQRLSKRTLPPGQVNELNATRALRHRIVHRGYRIMAGERGRAQRSVDTGRWIFNWFESNPTKAQIREKRIAFRSLGRDMFNGMFPTRITSDGVEISPGPF